jgi:Probable cobalt transporter subunit (CbtB)
MVSSSRVWRRTKQVTLSVPVQAALLTGLCMVTLWTLFFSTYPPVHDALHNIRHHTLGVGCH